MTAGIENSTVQPHNGKAGRPGWIGMVAAYLFIAAQITRTLADKGSSEHLPVYLGLMLAFVTLFTAASYWPSERTWLYHVYFMLQSAIILALLALNSNMDFITAFFMPLAYQAALFFKGRTIWYWIAGMALLTAGSLMVTAGALHGLALCLTTLAGIIIIPAYVVVQAENEAARYHSQQLLTELQETHRRLEIYNQQAEALAMIEERNRLARELHDTASQIIFSIVLTARSAQMLLTKDPTRVPEQLKRLQELTGAALSRLRTLITEMRVET